LKQGEEVVALVLENGPKENPPPKGPNGHEGVEQNVIRANCLDHQKSPWSVKKFPGVRERRLRWLLLWRLAVVGFNRRLRRSRVTHDNLGSPNIWRSGLQFLHNGPYWKRANNYHRDRPKTEDSRPVTED
jgi:hypothetical protein